jgi:hypothetical protein
MRSHFLIKIKLLLEATSMIPKISKIHFLHATFTWKVNYEATTAYNKTIKKKNPKFTALQFKYTSRLDTT